MGKNKQHLTGFLSSGFLEMFQRLPGGRSFRLAVAAVALLFALLSAASLVAFSFIVTIGEAAYFLDFSKLLLSFYLEISLSFIMAAVCARISLIIISSNLMPGIVWVLAFFCSLIGDVRSKTVRYKFWRIWKKYQIFIQIILFLILLKYFYFPDFNDFLYLAFFIIGGGAIFGLTYAFEMRSRNSPLGVLRTATSAMNKKNRGRGARAYLIALTVTISYISLFVGNIKALEKIHYSPEVLIQPMGIRASIVAKDSVGVLIYSKISYDQTQSGCSKGWCFLPWSSVSHLGLTDK